MSSQMMAISLQNEKRPIKYICVPMTNRTSEDRILRSYALVSWDITRFINESRSAFCWDQKIIFVFAKCRIRWIYLQSIAPLTIYLGRSFPRHVRCLSVTCSFFFCRFCRVSLSEEFLGWVRSNNFESSQDRSSFVIRCDYPVHEYKEPGRIEVVVSYLFCQA